MYAHINEKVKWFSVRIRDRCHKKMNETMVRMINCFGDCRIKFCAKWQNLDDMAKDV